MNDSMLMQAASREAELTREAGPGRLAARVRRSRPATRAGTLAGTMNGTAAENITAITEKAGSKQ